MRTALLRRNEKFEPIAKKKKPHFVIVPDRAECQQAGDFGSQLTLGLCGAAEIPGCAHIHDQHHGQFAFLGELLNERAAEPRRYVPIDGPDLVTGLVFADIFKIHSASLEYAVIVAGERGLDQGTSLNLQAADLPQNFFCALFPGRHGCATEPVIQQRYVRQLSRS